MRNLYISDLKKIFKDKLFLVTCILAVAFAVIMPLLYKVLFEALSMGDMLGTMLSTKNLTFTAFLPGDNLGLIMPILISIVVCKDFSQGTVRNKIIGGKSRSSIFISHFLSSATVMCALMLVYGLLTLCISLCFFPYQEAAFTWADFGYLITSLAFEIVVYIAISAIVTFIATISKNMGICILLYLAISFGLSIIGSIFSVAIMMLTPEDTGYKFLEFVNALNIYMSSLIGSGTSYSAKEVLYILLSPTLITAGCLLLGIRMFSRKNLK